MLEGTALGTVVELMVEAEILVGSDGRLIPSRVEPDVDHRDIVVAEVGGYGALWLQVKGTTHPDRAGRIVAFANYPVDAIPESARLLYLVSDWRDVLRESVRVAKPHASLMHEWGNGTVDEEWVQIRERARRLFEEAGLAPW